MQLDLSTIEKSFDIKQNSIGLVIIPSGNTYMELLPDYLINKAKNENLKFIDSNKTIYDQIENVDDLQMYAKNVSLLRYSINNCYLHDLACGIITDITLNKKDSRLISNLEITNNKIIADISKESLYNLMFGHIVNKNGRAIRGAGRIIERALESINPYLYKQIPCPIFDISISKYLQEKENKIIVRGTPISISRVYSYNKKISGFQIELDKIFYPIKNNEDNYLINSHYINQIIGLTAFLQYGKKLLKEKYDIIGIEAKQARRLILSCQAAIDAEKFPFVSYKDITSIQQSNTKKIQVSLKRGIVKNLCPSAIYDGNKIRYKIFIEFCNTIGKQYLTAFNELKLELNNKVLTPTEEKAAWFPKEDNKRVKIVFQLKGDND